MNSYGIYQALPVFAQNIACTAYGLKENKTRFSGRFHKFFEEFVRSDHLRKDEVLEYKKVQISKTLRSAKVSGLYSGLDDIDASLIDEDPWNVLQNLPLLSKQCVRGWGDLDFPRRRGVHPVVTSGTTGKALSFIKDSDSISAQWAVWFRHRFRFGVHLKDVSINFTGKPVVPQSQTKPPFWRYNAAQRQYLIGMQHISDQNIESLVEFLNHKRPKFYSGYPSIIAEMARLALDRGLNLSKDSAPDVVFTGAEKLLDYQKEAIQTWTGATVTDQYGLSEGCCNFSKCEYGYYHEDFEFCHIEIADGETLEDGSVRGRLIGTGFYNQVMPFVRYDTGDIAVMAPEEFVCSCGRSSRVIFAVDGRSDDFVLTPDGRRVMRFDYLFKDTHEVTEAQVVQSVPGRITVRAVLAYKGDKSAFEYKVRRHFDEYIAAPMALDFEYTDEIERTGSGKFKAVINRLEI